MSLAQAAPRVPVYFALTVDGRFAEKKFHPNLFLVGLASQDSPRGIDNPGYLQYNLERRFRLDYLDYDWYSETHPSTVPVVDRLSINYAYPFLLLAGPYQASGASDQAAHW